MLENRERLLHGMTLSHLKKKEKEKLHSTFILLQKLMQ